MSQANMSAQHTPGPWRWQGEDYRGGWGWQLLVGAEGQGIVCGESPNGPYKHLRAHMPIDPVYCKTGFGSDGESAPAVHVLEADARLIAAAPELLAALRALAAAVEDQDADSLRELIAAHAAIAKATGAAS